MTIAVLNRTYQKPFSNAHTRGANLPPIHVQ